MRSPRPLSRTLLLAALALAACQTDKPSTPTAPPPTNPVPPPAASTLDVTVSPTTLDAGSTQSSIVSVSAFQGSTPLIGNVVITTTLGSFTSVGGPQTITVPLVAGRAQVTLFPGTTAGEAIITATLTQAGQTLTDTARVQILSTSVGTFFVESITPNTGPPEGGQVVTIRGGGFDEPVRVTFNGTPAVVQSVTSDRIRVIVPSALAAGVTVPVGSAVPVTVAVTINVNEPGTATDTIVNGFIYTSGGTVQGPQVFSISPASGTNDGGTRVTIVGSGFDLPVQVFFGEGDVGSFDGVEAIVESVSSSQIIAITPAARGLGQVLLNNVVDVLVRNLDTGFTTVAPEVFKYGSNVLITSMGPGSGPFTGGTKVTIFGQGFDEPVAVSLGGVGQPVLSVTGTEIVFTTAGILVTTCPASGFVTVTGVGVTNIESGDGDTAEGLGFNFIVPLPQIFGVSPAVGSVGSSTTITGQNFAANVQVLFGGDNGSAAPVGPHTSTSITVTVPNPPPGFVFNTEPCDGNGDGIPNGSRNVPTPITITVRNLDGVGCVASLSNAFTLNPTNTTCTGDTSEPPPPPVVQCTDGFDNDSDGFIDAADPQCTGPTDDNEAA